MASWENQGAGSTRQTSMVNLQPDMLAEFSTTGGNTCILLIISDSIIGMFFTTSISLLQYEAYKRIQLPGEVF